MLVQEPTFPGCLIRCRAIGMFRMRDNTRPDLKVLCVPTADPRLAHLEPGKRIDVEHGIWAGRAEAEGEIKQSQDRVGTAGAVQRVM